MYEQYVHQPLEQTVGISFKQKYFLKQLQSTTTIMYHTVGLGYVHEVNAEFTNGTTFLSFSYKVSKSQNSQATKFPIAKFPSHKILNGYKLPKLQSSQSQCPQATKFPSYKIPNYKASKYQNS
jgi:hypothetical protein